MNKKGISEIVATVLIFFIVIVSVTLLWTSFFKVADGNLDNVEINGNVKILISEGYTLYDPENEELKVQVLQMGGDESLIKVKIVAEFDVNSEIILNEPAPGPNLKKVYTLNLKGVSSDKPDSVTVIPIFLSKDGEMEGNIVSVVENIPIKN